MGEEGMWARRNILTGRTPIPSKTTQPSHKPLEAPMQWSRLGWIFTILADVNFHNLLFFPIRFSWLLWCKISVCVTIVGQDGRNRWTRRPSAWMREKSCYWKWKDFGFFLFGGRTRESISSPVSPFKWEFHTTLLQVLEKYQWALRGKIPKSMLRNVWSLTNYFIVSGLFLLCCINWNQFSTHCLFGLRGVHRD